MCNGVCTTCLGEDEPEKWDLRDWTSDQLRSAVRRQHGLPETGDEDLATEASIGARIDYHHLVRLRAAQVGHPSMRKMDQ